MRTQNFDDITRYVSHSLVAGCENPSTVLRIVQKAGGVLLWAELVVGILNAAIGEGASPEMVDNTILEMPGDLDSLYEWLISTLTAEEKAETLALFQWVILASEPMRLNDLATAVRITPSWTAAEMRPDNALAAGPPSSLRALHNPNSPRKLRRWLRVASIGLLEVRPFDTDEPLGLQRVHAIHDSVRTFFLSGRGFAALDKNSETSFYSLSWSEKDLADASNYALLNACIQFLNLTDFDCLDSGCHLTLAPMRAEEVKYWRSKHDQHRLITSSYPFLQYAVDNLLYHMLSPRQFRYYLPQKEVLDVFAANNCRLWRRWTFLMGVNPGEPDVLATSVKGPAGPLLNPVYGARYRLERVFKRLSKLSNPNPPPYSTSREQGLPSPTLKPVEAPRKLKSCLKVETRKRQKPPVSLVISPRSSYSDRITSYTSTDVPSIFSPAINGPGSPMSMHSLMSPLSALEASFEAAKGKAGENNN